jgi:hypothetical protein
MDISQDKQPLARKEGLVVKEVSGEVLVYDLDRDRAHCLNQTAALVWKYCDGHTSVARIAKSLEKDLHAPVDQKVVWYALLQLEKDHLLEQRIVPPAIIAGMNRRDMIRVLGLAAVVAVPVVTSIVAPTPAQAATCLSSGAGCATSAQCCSGLCSGGFCA